MTCSYKAKVKILKNHRRYQYRYGVVRTKMAKDSIDCDLKLNSSPATVAVEDIMATQKKKLNKWQGLELK